MIRLRNPFENVSPCELVTREADNAYGQDGFLAGYYNHNRFLDWYPRDGDKLRADLYKSKPTSFDASDLQIDFSHPSFFGVGGDWVNVPGDQITFDLAGYQDYTYQSGDNVIIEVGCPVIETCDNHWKYAQHNDILIQFNCCDPTADCTVGTWVDRSYNDISFSFDCCGTQQQVEEVIFGLTKLQIGQTLTSSLENDIRFSSIVYHGERLSPSFTTAVVHNLYSRLYQGEALLKSPLITTSRLAAGLGFGERLHSVFKVAPVALLNSSIGHGERLQPRLVTTTTFTASLGAGEVLGKPTFTTYQSPAIAASLSYGEQIRAGLVNDIRFSSIVYQGEKALGYLTDAPDPGIKADVYHGDALNKPALLSDKGFNSHIRHGEGVYASFSVQTVLDTALGHGEELNAVVKFGETPEFSATVQTGERLYSHLTLGTSRFRTALMYWGEALKGELQPTPLPGLVHIIYHGETILKPELRTGANLGNVSIRHGEIATANVSELKNERLAHGEQITSVLATDAAFVAEIQQGELLTAEYYIKPSEPVGKPILSHGELLYAELKTMKSADLAARIGYSINIMAGLGDDGVMSYIDLDSNCCCPSVERHDHNRPDYHHIELIHQTPATFIHSADKVCVTGDLLTNQRFKADLTHGERLHFVPKDNYFSASLTYGERLTAVPEAKDVDFQLCPPNFVPDGDNVYFELETPDNFDCEAHYLHQGEEMHVKSLSTIQGLSHTFGEGQKLDGILSIYPPLRITFRHGERVRAWDGEMKTRLGYGEKLEAEFYEAPVIIMHGEEITGELVMKYDVRFLEQGCLDNEHIPQTPDGDPDWKRYTPVPIELRDYRHQIKAECF